MDRGSQLSFVTFDCRVLPLAPTMLLPSLKNLQFNRSFLLGTMFSKTWTKFSKTWTFPRAPKKERNQNRSRFSDFENVSSFTNRVCFPPIVLSFFRNQVFKNVDIPKGTKKRNKSQIVVGFVISKTFPPSQTALVFRLPTLFQRNVIFKNVDIPNETKIADHVVGFLTFHSFLEHGW